MRDKHIGIIGLDAMHAVALTTAINDANGDEYLGYRVTHAYPQGSKTLAYRIKNVPKYSRQVQALNVQIVDSIEVLLEQVDQVILTSNDGHVHLEQALPVIQAGKALFIDKPLTGNWEDAVALYHSAERFNTPVFSSSSLRFISGMEQLGSAEAGKILGAYTYSPAHYEPSLPELLWYGIHGIEMLYAVMGQGCQQVRRIAVADYDLVIGVWPGGRIGSFRGFRKGKNEFGGRAFGEHKVHELGGFEGYAPLAKAIVRFFDTRIAPVPLQETLEILAFIFAAQESKRLDGAPVAVKTLNELR